ncbi:hypothetical protein TraAM80_01776 [Trypanosoma rangeli]|uniref:J domain-containing protein n=1 Tax=Trypanosoma rangeli TaxID=5698 RepID=A0A422NX26_TRYRA|nr:uncharacterized protein TraAM80_01776 [Trypanosoma rangeli]RNF10040.1 hypothetical protein TraAM80_01776 [Trypanosoma rangeli]|eukprot:RNF10040.1 hypothetical protein TraAM80_01776 [Trypanosoma rangeli]
MNMNGLRALARCGAQRGFRGCVSRGPPPCARRSLGASLSVCITCVPHTTLTAQSRTQFAQVPGKRDQEAFLSQYNPLEVLALEESCTVEEIDEAFERMSAKYGPNGPCPDAKLLDRVFRAHAILKDPGSPYYLRAHSSDSERQRLQFQLLPKSKRRLIEVQVGILLLLLVGLAMLVLSLVLRPMKRSIRAATR